MSDLLPNLYDYLRNNYTTVKSSDPEFNYRLASYINKDYEICQNLIEVSFEEFINLFFQNKKLLFSFGVMGFDSNKKIHIKTHSKFKKYYGKRRQRNNIQHDK
jgi:hypothetical protein